MVVSAGKVKWFGGFNYNTGTENNYGFIADLSGRDIYLNKQEWHSPALPKEGDLVFYEINKTNNKWNANNAQSLSDQPMGQLIKLWKGLIESSATGVVQPIKKYITNTIIEEISSPESVELEKITNEIGIKELLTIASSLPDRTTLYKQIEKTLKKDFLKDLDWSDLPKKYFIDHEKEVIQALDDAGTEATKQKINTNLFELPENILIYCAIKGWIDSRVDVARVYRSADSILSLLFEGAHELPTYLSELIEKSTQEVSDRALDELSSTRPIEHSDQKDSLLKDNIDIALFYSKLVFLFGSHEQINKLKQSSEFDFLCSQLQKNYRWKVILSYLSNKNKANPILEINWQYLPQSFLFERNDILVEHILSLSKADAAKKIEPITDILPDETLLLCMLSGLINEKDKESLLSEKLNPLLRLNSKLFQEPPEFLVNFVKNNKTTIKTVAVESISKLIKSNTDGNIIQSYKSICFRLKSIYVFCQPDLTAFIQAFRHDQVQKAFREDYDYLSIISKLSRDRLIDPFRDIPWKLLPKSFIEQNVSSAAAFLVSVNKSDAQEIISNALESIPSDLLMLCCLLDLIPEHSDKEKTTDKLTPLIEALYKGKYHLPAYIWNHVSKEDYLKQAASNKIIEPIYSIFQFKKYLFFKNPRFVDYFKSTPSLHSKLDAFILKEIFGLFLAGNSIDVIYEIFQSNLWNKIISKEIDPKEQADEIIDLFPYCGTLGGLSCEAFYWPKVNIFLCRGSKCRDPQIIGNARKKHYLDYSIFDWFEHYGINYLEKGKPSQADFPIKLAGYFNRLREIFDHLHCSKCNLLMLPDFKYARTQHYVLEEGKQVLKDTSAAYRLTVFKCNNSQCEEFEKGYYINHCLGFECRNIIDSRIHLSQCDEGRYICNSCGSCCSNHGKSNPVGLCPHCTSPLNLYQLDENQDRYVKCSNSSCKFIIAPDKLGKRFSLPSCGTPLKGNPEHLPEIPAVESDYFSSSKAGSFGQKENSGLNPFVQQRPQFFNFNKKSIF